MRLKAYIAAAVMVAAMKTPAVAQLGNGDEVTTLPGSVTSDQPVEDNTSTIATSVTAGLETGWYTLNSDQISNFDRAVFSGVNAQNFTTNFPGWKPLPDNSTSEATRLTNVLQTTYGNALNVAQSQSTELENEDFSGIENASIGNVQLLAAVQANTEAQLQVVKQLQFERQLMISLITVEATRAAADLNEKARAQASSALSFMPGH